ncbi:MAG TPA: hypothetical protein VMV47_09765 [Bacteroidales bacterium]|nr:hypothetical protein [Bacteroidales bacterium]
MKIKVALFSICSFLSVIAVSQENNPEVLPIKSRLEIFVDSLLIESLENLELRMHVPADRGTVLKFDRPWEGPFSAYSTVIKDGPVYRLYYRGLATTKGESTNEEVTCYAESADGIIWTKPDLRLFKVLDTWDNNIVLAGSKPASHNFSPFLDTNPGRSNGKFKALGGLTEGLLAFVSDDGVLWKKLRETPVLTGEPFDSQNIAFWSVNENCYVCYFRKWIESGGKSVRSVGRSTSVDFINWSKPEAMNFGNTPLEELYTNQTSPYYRAPHIYISTAARFFPGKQVITEEQAKRLNVNPGYFKDCADAVLLTSRGGTTYQRTFREGFLRPGIGLNNWISRTNYPALNVVQTGETEISFYVNQDYAQPTANLHRYSLRIDGFASLHAKFEPGELVTKKISFTGSELILNFSTSAAGYILVEILDTNGSPLQEFSFENCIPVIGNEIERTVEWRSSSDLTKLNNIPVRIRFRIKDADLYSFRFR